MSYKSSLKKSEKRSDQHCAIRIPNLANLSKEGEARQNDSYFASKRKYWWLLGWVNIYDYYILYIHLLKLLYSALSGTAGRSS